MKVVLKSITLAAIVVSLSACGTNPPQGKYAITTPNDNLLYSNPVPPPPMTPQDYSLASCNAKEAMWVGYSMDLLNVIGKEHADKEGLRLWKKGVLENADRLNKGVSQ